MLVSMNDSGAAYEYGIAINAARWKITSTSFAASRTMRASRISPSTGSIAARTSALAVSSQPHEPCEL